MAASPSQGGLECVLPPFQARSGLIADLLSFKARADNCDFSSPGAKEIALCKCLRISGPHPQGCSQPVSRICTNEIKVGTSNDFFCTELSKILAMSTCLS